MSNTGSQGSTLIFLAARQSSLLLPDAAGPGQTMTDPDQLFVSKVRKCIIKWFSLADKGFCPEIKSVGKMAPSLNKVGHFRKFGALVNITLMVY